MKIGIMITSKCDFACKHCMFTCSRNGKHMTDEIIRATEKFIEKNDIEDISIYGGEPFLDMDHFEKCMLAFYDDNKDFFISSNGSFLSNPKRKERVIDWVEDKFRHNFGEISAIRISNTPYHQELQSDKLKHHLMDLKELIDSGRYYEEDFPVDWNNPGYHSHTRTVYVDGLEARVEPNPSGRALLLNSTRENLHCICNVSPEGYETKEEWISDMAAFQVYSNGRIAVCCYGESGTIGDIREIETVDSVIQKALSMHEKMKPYKETSQRDRCSACRKFYL